MISYIIYIYIYNKIYIYIGSAGEVHAMPRAATDVNDLSQIAGFEARLESQACRPSRCRLRSHRRIVDIEDQDRSLVELAQAGMKIRRHAHPADKLE